MAFAGVALGMCARVLFPDVESEMGLPMLIREVLPIGVTGIVIAAYFSAIMSTADSCLMAASGNFVNDILQRYLLPGASQRALIRISQAATLVIGVLAVLIAAQFEKVLDAMLYAYGFMVSGLFVPTLGAYFWKRSSAAGAIAGMLGGGLLTTLLQVKALPLPAAMAAWKLDPACYGLALSALLFVAVSLLVPGRSAAHGD
jgi:SSS family solute:Na+ symporter